MASSIITRKRLNFLLSSPWLPGLLALLGALMFLLQSLIYAHAQDVTMDEGTYLMKGLLFLRGDYTPFQEFGPWTNKMPLAFLIPGLAQEVFGPGLRTGRYFSIFLGLLMLLALWLTTRRLTGRWWAAAMVWLLAVSPALMMIYSQAISQVIVACLLAWALYFTLGERLPVWQTTLGSVLAAAMVLTRQNMLPVVPILVVYIFWQHGRRAGVYAAAASGFALLAVHLIYWPRIMEIWLPWLPGLLKSPFTGLRVAHGGTAAEWYPAFGWDSKLYVLWDAVRSAFFPLAGAVVSWILWPRYGQWKSSTRFRAAVCLSALLIVLGAAHYWAAAFKDYCLYCFQGYLAFFIPAAFLLVPLAFSSWMKRPGRLRQLLAAAFVLLASTGIAYGAYQQIHGPILNLPIPRVTNMRIQPGTTELWRSLSNKFGLSYETLQQLLPTLAGFGAGILLLLAAGLYVRWARRSGKRFNFGFVALVLFFSLGVIFTPTAAFSGNKTADLCSEDVIASHEAVGQHLSGIIPPGSLVFWQNDVTPLPLLYLDQPRIFPPQLNHWYTYREGGDPNLLWRAGLWNTELADRWALQADYVLLADAYVERWSNKTNVFPYLDELAPTPLTVPCRGQSIIHVFRRVP